MSKESYINSNDIISNNPEITGDQLISLVRTGSVLSVENILKHAKQVDINYVSEDGDTALRVAAERNDPKMMEMLINCGATMDEDDNEYINKVAGQYRNADMLELLTSNMRREGCSNKGS